MPLSNTTTSFDELIERVVGLPIDTIRQQDSEQTDAFIEKRMNISLQLGKPDHRVGFRGNPLFDMGRVISNDVDAEFNAKFGYNENYRN